MKRVLYTKVSTSRAKMKCSFCKYTIPKGATIARVGNTSQVYHAYCAIKYIQEKKYLLSKTLAVLVKKIKAAYDGKISDAKEPEAAKVGGED
jgi:hypothetical protein